MAVYLTADWHLGETRMELMQRPFENANDMFATLIKNFNEVIKPEDELVIVGDLCVDPLWLYAVRLFRGRKTLIRGNHDRKFTDAQLTPIFERIVPEGEGLDLLYHDKDLFVTHYPTSGKIDSFNLVGHIHGLWKLQLNMLNVGVDVHAFRPVPLERVMFFINAIENYYDDDAWAAYHPANIIHRDRPKKTGSYLLDKPATS